MNGCHPDKIISGKCVCEHHEKYKDICTCTTDTVSKYDGFPMCPFKEDAVSRDEWEKVHKPARKAAWTKKVAEMDKEKKGAKEPKAAEAANTDLDEILEGLLNELKQEIGARK